MRYLVFVLGLVLSTGLMAADVYNMTDTWDDGTKTWNAIKMDVTDSASQSDSKLLNLLVGGSQQFEVVKTGDTTAWGSLIVNEGAEDADFRVESTNETNMLLVSAAQDQVNVHTDFNADWGALNVGARNASSGTEVDMVATLGDGSDSADVNGNNIVFVREITF